jgi:DNA-binding transcriptional ArsR family regulator
MSSKSIPLQESEQFPVDEDVLVIRDFETLKLLADPLRIRMLELMRQGQTTAKQLASALQVSQTRLYYHLKLLETRGLITVVETRLVSGIVEKHYRTVGGRLTVDKSLIGPTLEGSDALDAYVSIVLDEVKTEINRSIDAGLIDLERTKDDELRPRQLLLGRKWLKLTAQQLEDFARAYAALIDQFEDAVPGAEVEPAPGEELYEWLVAFYPVVVPGRRIFDPASAADESHTP